MRRPQSAKPGHRGYWAQGSSDDFYQGDNNIKGNTRKNVKLVKPDLTTNDFARILPKKIYQDKQRLYSEGLQLKQNLNETVEENVRLKTRISILEKEKDKLTRHIELGRDGGGGNMSMAKTNSRVNVYNNKNSEKENMMIRNLKKMIKESKDQNEYLKQQNAKIKKAIKYTKINELQIERKMLQQQNKRVATLLEEMNEQLQNQDMYEREISDMKGYIAEQENANQQLGEANQKFEEYIQSLQEKMATDQQKAQSKENRLQREAALNKRRMNEALRQVDDLRKQINTLKESNSNVEKKKAKLTRPVTSNPYKKEGGGGSFVASRLATDNKKEADKEKDKDKENGINAEKFRRENEQLKQELNLARSKLEETERMMKEDREKAKSMVSQKPKVEESPQKEQNKLETVVKKKDSEKYSSDQEDEYGDEGFSPQRETSPSKDPRKNRNPSEIDEYKKDFEAAEEEEPLYVKDQQQQKDQKKAKKKTKAFKPQKKLLSQIKEVVTYRFKAQRYTFSELKKDVDNAEQSKFHFLELKSMFMEEPFYLTESHAETMLQYVYEKQKIKNDSVINKETLLNKIRKIVDDFDLIDQQQEQQMMYNIAQTVTEYAQELQASFEMIKNGEQTVSRQDFIEMFQKLEMERKYIEIMIQELSLCSEDLNHLNFNAFFERFYLQGLENGQLVNNPIDEEQLESSGDEHSRNLKSKDSAKVKELRKQFEETDENLVIDDGEKISLGNDDYNIKDGDHSIVSDDGPI